MAYIIIDETKRITAASETHHCGEGEIEVKIPEEAWTNGIHNYKYDEGSFVHDPLPMNPIEVLPTAEERIEALEAAVTMLCMPDAEV